MTFPSVQRLAALHHQGGAARGRARRGLPPRTASPARDCGHSPSSGRAESRWLKRRSPTCSACGGRPVRHSARRSTVTSPACTSVRARGSARSGSAPIRHGSSPAICVARCSKNPRPIDRRYPMLFRVALFAATLLLAPSAQALTITYDPGGRIDRYEAHWRAIASSGETVRIDGLCNSACTLLTGLVPPRRVCVTPRAVLSFHAAWMEATGPAVASAPATAELMRIYPVGIRPCAARRPQERSASHPALRAQATALLSRVPEAGDRGQRPETKIYRSAGAAGFSSRAPRAVS
jgi:hypothetical protein